MRLDDLPPSFFLRGITVVDLFPPVINLSLSLSLARNMRQQNMLVSDLTLDLTAFRPENTAKSTQLLNDGLIEKCKQDIKWWDVSRLQQWNFVVLHYLLIVDSMQFVIGMKLTCSKVRCPGISNPSSCWRNSISTTSSTWRCRTHGDRLPRRS